MHPLPLKARTHHRTRNNLSCSSLMHSAMPSTAARRISLSVLAAATAAETIPADQPYLLANASSGSAPSASASTAAAAEDDATLLDARSGPSQLTSSSSSAATAISNVDAGADHPHRLNGGGAPPPQHNPASLDMSASSSAAAASSLLFATPKGRGGGGAHGPALVVFSGGTAFNVVAGEWGREGGRMTKVMGWVTRVIVTSTCPLKLTD